MGESRVIAVADLMVDPRNPRLEEGLTTQLDALHSMLRHLGKKILVLAADIVENGINPTERLIVMPSEEDPLRYTVLEGNRRVTALKVLESPKLAEGILSKSAVAKLQDLGRAYASRPINHLDCWLVNRREDAVHWMRVRHEAGTEGAGIVSWGATEKQRFASWRGGAPTAAIQIMNLVLEHGGLDEKTRSKVRDVPTSSFMRVVQNPYAAAQLGVQYTRRTGELKTLYPEAEIAKGFTRLLRDLADENITSRSINRAEDIRNYVDSFEPRERPAPSANLGVARQISTTATPDTTSTGVTSTGVSTSGTATKPRKALVPSSTKLKVDNARLRDVLRELRTLTFENHPNAIAVLLRVFVELSVDHYLSTKLSKTEQELDGMKLREKLISSANALQQSGQINSSQYDAVRHAAQDQLLLATALKTFHAYVHNRYVMPKSGDLRAAWDELEPFLTAIWS